MVDMLILIILLIIYIGARNRRATYFRKQTEMSFTETLTKLGGYSYKVTALAGNVEGLEANLTGF